MNNLIIFGSGGHSRSVLSIAKLTSKWKNITIVDLNLPGNFAFQTEKFSFTGNGITTTVSSMFPENPSAENRNREARITLNNVTVSIT